MRTISLYFILFVLVSTGNAKSQVSADEAPLVLEDLFDRLVNNYNDKDRIGINDSIRMILDGYVRSDTVFAHRFNNLRYLGQITSPDSLLKIITWNLVLENEPDWYFCYFVRREESEKGNKIYRLSARYNELPIKTEEIYTASDWYGALYYDLRRIVVDNKPAWVILGIDYGNTAISRKIIDVLSFTPEDSIVFGRKWFASDEEIKYRVVFEYASTATMALRFGTDSSIVFEHLIPISPSLKDNRQYYVPDYSFDAYNFENGIWKLTINVDARNRE